MQNDKEGRVKEKRHTFAEARDDLSLALGLLLGLHLEDASLLLGADHLVLLPDPDGVHASVTGS